MEVLGQALVGVAIAEQLVAQTAKRSPEFAASYAAIAKWRETKIATIAIARKFLTRALHLLSDIQAAEASTPPRRP